MECAVCGWPIRNAPKQWAKDGFAWAVFRCDECECEMTVKTPMSKMAHRWPKDLSSS